MLECFGDELEVLESQRRQQRLNEARGKRQGKRRAAASETQAAVSGLNGEAGQEGKPDQLAASAPAAIGAQLQREVRQRRKHRRAEQQAAGEGSEEVADGNEQQQEQEEKVVSPGQHRHQRRQAEKLTERQRQRQESEDKAQWARAGGSGLPGKVRTPEQHAAHQERMRAQRERRAQLKQMRLEERQRAAMAYILGEEEAGAATNAAHAAPHPTKAHLRRQRPVVAAQAEVPGQEEADEGRGQKSASSGGGSSSGGSSSVLRSGWDRIMSLFK